MATATQGPTHDKDLYSFATMKMETRAQHQIDEAFDKQRLARWFGEQLRQAYEAGLRDGYVQGTHDRHTNGVGRGVIGYKVTTRDGERMYSPHDVTIVCQGDGA